MAHQRASREPIYGLFVVTCPRCGRVAARRRNVAFPMRRFEPVLTLIGLAVVQVLIFAGATELVTTWLDAVQFTAGRDWILLAWIRLVGTSVGFGRSINPAVLFELRSILFWGVGMGLAIGMMLAVLLHHLSRTMRLIVFFILAAIALIARQLLDMGMAVHPSPFLWQHVVDQCHIALGGLIVLVTLMPLILAGMSLGDRAWRVGVRSKRKALRRLVERRTRRIHHG